MSDYTGNSALPAPSVVRLPDDSAPQRATSYNPAYQDLADQVAALKAQTYARKGSATDMMALTTASLGDPFFVPGQGWYSLIPASGYTEQHPWIYDASASGAGRQWMHELWLALLNPGNPAKISPSWISNAIIKCGGLLVVSTLIADTVSGGTYRNLKDDGGADVAANGAGAVAGVNAGDELHLTVGPLLWSISTGGLAKLRTHILQGTTHTYYEKQYIDDIGTGRQHYVQDSIRHTCLAGDLSIFIEVASVTGTNSIQSPVTWGPGRFEWAHYQLVRP